MMTRIYKVGGSILFLKLKMACFFDQRQCKLDLAMSVRPRKLYEARMKTIRLAAYIGSENSGELNYRYLVHYGKVAETTEARPD